jgi:tetratricopeptide (TPR) repeat protein
MSGGDGMQRFDRLRELFDRIAEIDPALRDAAIGSECGGDHELERELRALLEADDRVRGRTGQTRLRILEEGQQALSSAAEPGERVGPWLLREVIGRGGMGVVYRGERADGEVRQAVAVKVLQRMHVDDAGVRRFAQERDIVAQLAHPGIARLFDAGTTREGSPYYAMELVDGEPIVDWCERRRASLAERLDAFLAVCEAVRFAHANLVLHRDIKPANVLVDAHGAPKLIDFGIARPLNDLDATQAGLQLFSPSNAAPEQVRGERCGVACDVYQLGTLLYELLTGTTVLGDDKQSPAEIEAAILHRVPPLPSEVVARKGDRLGSNALRGDLDTIVMRALRKEPSQRYASVEQLADEIRRHRRNEPIAARGGERRYRIGRFVRRNLSALAAGAAIVALAITVVVVQLVQSQRLERERDAARVERNRAQAASTFLANLFHGADQGQALGRSLSAEDVLRRGRDHLDRELAGQPELRIPLMGTLAIIYSALGDHRSALRLVDEADRALAEGTVLDDRALIAYLVQNGRVRAGAGDLAGVERAARTALGIHERLRDPPGVRWEARSQLLRVELQRADRSTWKETLSALLRQLGADATIDPLVLARARADAGRTLELVEEYEQGEALLRQALATFESNASVDGYDTLNTRRALGSILVAMGRAEEGLPVMEEVLEREIESWGPHAPMVARSRIRVGTALSQLRRFDEAEALLLHAEESMANVGEFRQPDVMSVATALGDLYLEMARFEDAERRFREALEIAEAGPDQRCRTSLRIRYGLGRALAAQRRWPDALAALATCEPYMTWTMPMEGRWAVTYAEVLHALGRDAEATALLDRAQPLIDGNRNRRSSERSATPRRAVQG